MCDFLSRVAALSLTFGSIRARAGVCAGINASARKVINFATATSADLDEIRLNIPQMPVQWKEWYLNPKDSSARQPITVFVTWRETWHTGACTINRPCAQRYVGKSQSCMVISGRLIVHAPVWMYETSYSQAAHASYVTPHVIAGQLVVAGCPLYRAL